MSSGLMHPRVAHNNAKAGFYPTDIPSVERIAQALELANPNQLTRVIDPCAGEGIALSNIAKAIGQQQVETYAVEYEQNRAAQAATLTNYCLRSDLFDTVISAKCFGLLFLNPPYGDMAPDPSKARFLMESEGRKRLEKEFYQHSLAYLQYGGVLVFIIPHTVLDEQMARWIATHYSEIRIYEAVDKQFKQVVIFGVRTRSNDIKRDERENNIKRLQAIYNGEINVEELPEVWPFEPYQIPSSTNELKHFYRVSIEPEQFAEEINRVKGLWPEFKLRLKHMQSASRAPLTKLSDWHLSLALAAGEIHGVVQSPISGRVLAIRGDTYKVKKRHTEYTDDGKGNVSEQLILTDKFVPTIKAWDMTPDSPDKGKLFNIASGVNQAKLEEAAAAENQQDPKQPEPCLFRARETIPGEKFPVGRLITTPGIRDLEEDGLLDYIPYVIRHSRCDWGDDLEECDKELNDRALTIMEDGHLIDRLFSSYIVDAERDLKIWIITEYHDEDIGHVTTILLPSEY